MEKHITISTDWKNIIQKITDTSDDRMNIIENQMLEQVNLLVNIILDYGITNDF